MDYFLLQKNLQCCGKIKETAETLHSRTGSHFAFFHIFRAVAVSVLHPINVECSTPTAQIIFASEKTIEELESTHISLGGKKHTPSFGW